MGGGFTLTTETHQGRNNGRADEMIYLTSRKICGTLAHKPNLLIYPIKRYKRDDNKWTCKILLVKIIYCPSLFSGQSILKVPKFCFCGVNHHIMASPSYGDYMLARSAFLFHSTNRRKKSITCTRTSIIII